jgi:hypothetical protein
MLTRSHDSAQPPSEQLLHHSCLAGAVRLDRVPRPLCVSVMDHSSLAVTTTYLRRLEGQEDLSWRHVAEAIGVN